MEDIECMDKFVKSNHTIFLFIEKEKNLDLKKKKKKANHQIEAFPA